MAHGGALVPFAPLGEVLRRPEPREPRRSWSAVFVESGGAVVAIGADRLVGTGDVVVRAFPAFLQAEPAVAGRGAGRSTGTRASCSIPQGSWRRSAPPRRWKIAARRARLPLLVVDDSLTTRMLEQSILESAGYEVDLAVSAEEALDKARARRYGLFIVDVEMPGMDGFDLLRTTRADPQLASIPAILVTSRAAPEDRRRGVEVGARGYLVKASSTRGGCWR